MNDFKNTSSETPEWSVFTPVAAGLKDRHGLVMVDICYGVIFPTTEYSDGLRKLGQSASIANLQTMRTEMSETEMVDWSLASI